MPLKSRNASSKAELIADAWAENAPDAKFAGMTVTQFRNGFQPSVDSRAKKSSLRSQLRAAMEETVTADQATRKLNVMVASAVKADPDHGPDSPLYAAMGYVPTSLRKSGKTNKTNGNGNGNGQPHP